MKPPTLATWLLTSFGVNPSIVGDIVERYEQRCSSTWYWRQTIIAICGQIGRDIAGHRLLAIRAIVVGYAVQIFLLQVPVFRFTNLVGLWMWNWTIANDLDGLRELWFGRTNRFALPPLPILISTLLVWLVTGWIVGRLHRSRPATAVTLYAVFAVLGDMWWFWTQAAFMGRASLIDLTAKVVYMLIVHPIVIVLGGLWSARPATADEHSVAHWRS